MKAVLSGSDKQIAWAEEIRTQFEGHAETLARDVPEWINPRVRARFAELVQTITANWLATTTSAKAWIDHKDLSTKGGVESFFVARLKRDTQAQALMQTRRRSR